MSLPESLRASSDLTEKQFESLVSYLRVRSGAIRLKDAAASRSGRPVSIGSYYHTVAQGRERVRRSIATVLVATSLGLVRTDDVRRLFELVAQSSNNAEVDSARLSEVLGSILDQVVL